MLARCCAPPLLSVPWLDRNLIVFVDPGTNAHRVDADEYNMAVKRGTPAKSFIKSALGSVLGVVTGEATTADVRAKLKVYRGESSVGRALRGLPEGWRVFHGVDLGGERADHVVAGPRGVFNVDAKKYAGPVVANSRGLQIDGHRSNRPVEQAMRHAGKLEKRLGLEVRPVLAIVGADLTGDDVDGLPVMMLDRLTKFLLSDDGRRLSWEEAKRVFVTLEAMTR